MRSHGDEGNRVIWDYRVMDWITVDAYLFNARIGARDVEFQVNPEFGSEAAARVEVDAYAADIGRLPAVLLSNLAKVHVNAGRPAHPEAATFQPRRVFGGNRFDQSITIHTGTGEEYRQDGFLEEVLFHEGAHVSVDGAVVNDPAWHAAQGADGEFISDYARDNPDREDVAESILPYFAVRFRPDRLRPGQRQAIEDVIPARLEYFDAQGFDWSPVVPPGEPAAGASGSAAAADAWGRWPGGGGRGGRRVPGSGRRSADLRGGLLGADRGGGGGSRQHGDGDADGGGHGDSDGDGHRRRRLQRDGDADVHGDGGPVRGAPFHGRPHRARGDVGPSRPLHGAAGTHRRPAA